uniref:Metalloendopeptidase n=1 Tax=Trichuris muris TaxID=70415 RepID=A0A5S6QJ00_TRIMR
MSQIVPFILSSVSAARIPAEDIIRSGVSEYETSLDVDDFVDNFAMPEVNLRSLGLQNNKDPLLQAGKFEGDIAGFAGATPLTFKRDPVGVAHNAVRDTWHRWVDAEVPYVLSSRYGRYSRKVIARAMDEFHRNTCIRFVPRERLKHRDYVYIEPEDGCYSMVGRMGGKQPISLDAGCMEVGIVVHELMHTIGFFHEQSRTDRDDWIRINWRNILPGASDQFDKYDSRTMDLLGATYDYDSIMHYGPYAFSRNGQRTIDALRAGGEAMGQRKGFSETDIYKLNKLYWCDEHGNGAEGQSGEKGTGMTTMKHCEDVNGHCKKWRQAGFCDKIGYRHFMAETCAESCGKCAPRSIASLMSGCKDSEGFKNRCQLYATWGMCQGQNKPFMEKACPMSCNFCFNKEILIPRT